MKQKICGAIALLALLWLFGIAGSSDLGLNTVEDIIKQGGASLAIFTGSLYLGGYLDLGPSKGGHNADRH